jgi:hypothetical protein
MFFDQNFFMKIEHLVTEKYSILMNFFQNGVCLFNTECGFVRGD